MELIVPLGTHLSGERSDSAAVPDVMALPRMRQGEPELQASLGYIVSPSFLLSHPKSRRNNKVVSGF